MADPKPLLFSQDFRQIAPRAVGDAELKRAEGAAYERGFADGRVAADLAAQERLTTAMERLAAIAGELLAERAATQRQAEAAAVEFALLFARRLGGAAVSRAPLAPIAEAASACFEHVVGAPHLAARVHESLVDETERVLSRLAAERGFEGKMIVLGEPDIAPGDVRLDWADGAVVREHQDVEARIAAAVADWAADAATRR